MERERTGRGQVVDANVVDGSALFMANLLELHAQGRLRPRGHNRTDSGAPHYDCYETADGRYMAVGCVEDKFYKEFLDGIGLALTDLPDRADEDNWPTLKKIIADRIRCRELAEWNEIFASRDACVTPVLTVDELAADPHLVQRGTYVEREARLEPSPSPRFGNWPAGDLPATAPTPGDHSAEILAELGYDDYVVARLRSDQVIV